MDAESGCTQIRSCTVCMPNLGGPRSLVAGRYMHAVWGRKDTIAAQQPAQPPAAERLEDAALLSYDPAPGGMRCRQQLGY